MKIKNILLLLFAIASFSLVLESCKPDEPITPEPSGPSAYPLEIPGNWPKPNILPENPLTVEGVALGRKLFYDKMLSSNGTQACVDCHHQSNGFTDLGKKVSTGAFGDIGTKNSMPLHNLNWSSGYFWNGRQPTLESLIQEPIEAHNEMHLKIDEAVIKVKADPNYPALFNAAFPNQGVSELTLRYAMAQFLRTIISANTAWDKIFSQNFRNPEKLMNPAQARGYLAFIDENKGDCFHCHSPISPFLSNSNEREFANNGLDINPDTGYFKVTGNINDLGKFKTPSLRNLVFSAPYMHDGRFATLDEVLEHYNSGFKNSPNVDPVILTKHGDPNNNYKPIPRLTQQDKDDIIAFLMLITDSTLVTNPAFSKP